MNFAHIQTRHGEGFRLRHLIAQSIDWAYRQKIMDTINIKNVNAFSYCSQFWGHLRELRHLKVLG